MLKYAEHLNLTTCLLQCSYYILLQLMDIAWNISCESSQNPWTTNWGLWVLPFSNINLYDFDNYIQKSCSELKNRACHTSKQIIYLKKWQRTTIMTDGFQHDNWWKTWVLKVGSMFRWLCSWRNPLSITFCLLRCTQQLYRPPCKMLCLNLCNSFCFDKLL